MMATGLVQVHVHAEDLTGGGDPSGVLRVADPVAGFGVVMAGRISEQGANLRRGDEDGARDDVLPQWSSICLSC